MDEGYIETTDGTVINLYLDTTIGDINIGDIRHIQVPIACRVILFSEPEFGGKCLILFSNTPFICFYNEDGTNAYVRSIKVKECIKPIVCEILSEENCGDAVLKKENILKYNVELPEGYYSTNAEYNIHGKTADIVIKHLDPEYQLLPCIQGFQIVLKTESPAFTIKLSNDDNKITIINKEFDFFKDVKYKHNISLPVISQITKHAMNEKLLIYEEEEFKGHEITIIDSIEEFKPLNNKCSLEVKEVEIIDIVPVVLGVKLYKDNDMLILIGLILLFCMFVVVRVYITMYERSFNHLNKKNESLFGAKASEKP